MNFKVIAAIIANAQTSTIGGIMLSEIEWYLYKFKKIVCPSTTLKRIDKAAKDMVQTLVLLTVVEAWLLIG